MYLRLFKHQFKKKQKIMLKTQLNPRKKRKKKNPKKKFPKKKNQNQ
jgi:hypothetical protein